MRPAENEGSSTVPIEVIENAALLVDNGIVVAAGQQADVERHPRSNEAKIFDWQGRVALPGFVDSHTHIVFAGDRVPEMHQRSHGATYEQIAEGGGGIQNSAQRLAKTSADELLTQARPRLSTLIRHGTTTCEIKSGYGLQPAAELKQLQVIEQLARQAPIDIYATILAHVVPATEKNNRSSHIARLCNEVIAKAPEFTRVRYIDVFIEQGAFSDSEAEQIVHAGRHVGLKPKLHVDQLRDNRGGELAAKVGALSADHLEYCNAHGRAALAQANVVATILPGCGMFLGKGPWPDGRALRASGCEVAIATDCNPGTSMIFDLALCATLAITRCGLTFEEALWGITRGGAKALGLNDRGGLHQGERADFVILQSNDWRHLFYSPGDTPIAAVASRGNIVYSAL